MSNVQTWVAIVSGVAGFIGLAVTNIVLLTRFFSGLTARFDILNERVESLKDEFRRDIDRLGTRVERAVEKIDAGQLHDVASDARITALEERVGALEPEAD